jgi:hypothetical protein
VSRNVIPAITAFACVYGTTSESFRPVARRDTTRPTIGTTPAATFRISPDCLFHRRRIVNANRMEAALKAIPVTASGSSRSHCRTAPVTTQYKSHKVRAAIAPAPPHATTAFAAYDSCLAIPRT